MALWVWLLDWIWNQRWSMTLEIEIVTLKFCGKSSQVFGKMGLLWLQYTWPLYPSSNYALKEGPEYMSFIKALRSTLIRNMPTSFQTSNSYSLEAKSNNGKCYYYNLLPEFNVGWYNLIVLKANFQVFLSKVKVSSVIIMENRIVWTSWSLLLSYWLWWS